MEILCGQPHCNCAASWHCGRLLLCLSKAVGWTKISEVFPSTLKKKLYIQLALCATVCLEIGCMRKWGHLLFIFHLSCSNVCIKVEKQMVSWLCNGAAMIGKQSKPLLVKNCSLGYLEPNNWYPFTEFLTNLNMYAQLFSGCHSVHVQNWSIRRSIVDLWCWLVYSCGFTEAVSLETKQIPLPLPEEIFL